MIYGSLASADNLALGSLADTGQPYTVPGAVTFGGSTYLSRGAWLTGVNNASKLTYVGWQKSSVWWTTIFHAASSKVDVSAFASGNSPNTYYWAVGANSYGLYFDTWPGSELDSGSPIGGVATGAWQHIAMSFDLSSSPCRVRFRINGIEAIAEANNYLPGSPTYMADASDFFFGGDGADGNYQGDLADQMIWYDQFTDFNLSTVMTKFYNNGPVNPSLAIAALGTPTISFIGNSTNFPINGGSGGAFTLNGSLTNAASVPFLPSPNISFAGQSSFKADSTIL